VAIRAAMNWAVEQARSKCPVISGFHSPLKQSVLQVLLAAGNAAVAAPPHDRLEAYPPKIVKLQPVKLLKTLIFSQR